MNEPDEPLSASRGVVRGDFSREEFDRIIRRASELQAEASGGEDGAEIREEEILRIGREVGLEPRHLRRALGEARADGLRPAPPVDGGALARLIGPGFLQASRVVPGPLSEVESRLESHLRTGECLRRVRKRGERSLWEPEGHVFAKLRRALRMGDSTYDLARASTLDLTLTPLGEGHLLVTMIADVRRRRGESGVGAMVGMGVSGTAVGLVAGFALSAPLVAIPVGLLGVTLGRTVGRRSFGGEVERIRLAMEGLLDRLEAGEALEGSARSRWPHLRGR